MIEVFALIGVAVVLLTIVSLVYIGIILLIDLVKRKKYEHKAAHRFDKPPVAKCYCEDCTMWDRDNKHCMKFSCRMEDCNFCCFAEPKMYELEEE